MDIYILHVPAFVGKDHLVTILPQLAVKAVNVGFEEVQLFGFFWFKI